MTAAELQSVLAASRVFVTGNLGGANYAIPTLAWLRGPCYDAFKAKYPQLQLIATAREAKTRTPDLYDDHYYRKAVEFYKDLAHYDKMDRKGPKVFVGEYAVTTGYGTYGNLTAALGEAAFMTGIERNCDVVAISAAAAALEDQDYARGTWQHVRAERVRLGEALHFVLG